MAKNPKEPDFERSLAELESLVQKLESGDLPLEEALKTFERGIALTRSCQTALKAAQQKVEILLKKSGKWRSRRSKRTMTRRATPATRMIRTTIPTTTKNDQPFR